MRGTTRGSTKPAMKLAFPWQRRASPDTGEATPPRRSLSPGSLLRGAFQPKARTPSPHRRRPPEEPPVQLAPTGSAAFAAAAGSASSVDESTLRTLLMRQPAAQELGLTDDALMDSFVRSCAVSGKPSPGSAGSPSSVVSSAARYTCAQYLRVVADLSQYRHDVRGGTLIVGNGRSVLQSHAGGLVDNYGAVVRFNDYQTEGFATHVGTKTTLWVLSDWVCIKLINKYPARTVPILICIPFKFMGNL